jgi:hypothetical protein
MVYKRWAKKMEKEGKFTSLEDGLGISGW